MGDGGEGEEGKGARRERMGKEGEGRGWRRNLHLEEYLPFQQRLSVYKANAISRSCSALMLVEPYVMGALPIVCY